jgi:membrane protein DedA with SNARE-associated domain
MVKTAENRKSANPVTQLTEITTIFLKSGDITHRISNEMPAPLTISGCVGENIQNTILSLPSRLPGGIIRINERSTWHKMDMTLVQQFPYFGLFLLLVLGAVGFPFPEDAVLILCGFMIHNAVVQPMPALVIVGFGMLTTDFFLYYVGRKYGRKIVSHKRFRRVISSRRLVRLKRLFEKWGVFVIFLGRHLVGLRSQIFLVAGVLKMPRIKFVLADAVSSAVTMTIMVGAGYWGGNTLEKIRYNMEDAGYALLILIFLIIVALVIWRMATQKIGEEAESGK